MKVSILIPVYNSEKYLSQTIKSALSQTWTNKEIIIIDDGSTDDSFTIAKSFESNCIKVYNQINQGASIARNRALEYSTGEYIQYLDADDMLSPNKIANQMNRLKGYYFDSTILIFCPTYIFDKDISSAMLYKQDVNKSYLKPSNLLLDLFKTNGLISSHAYLVHRSLIVKSGGWDESLTANDDGEFFSRIISNSKNVIFNEDGIAYYRKANQHSLSQLKNIQSTLSEYQSLKKISELIFKFSEPAEAIYACENIFNWFIVDWYPMNKKILFDVEKTMDSLNLKYKTSSKSLIYHELIKSFGWRRALIFSDFYSKLKRQIKG